MGPAAQTTIITKDFGTQQKQRIRTEAEMYRAVAGVRGDIGNTETWTWEAYYQLGHATRDQIGDDYRTQYRFLMAVDSVINPATGQPDCRVNVSNPASGVYPFAGMDPFLVQGCAPINPFGQTMSEAASDYAFDPLEEYNTIDQQVLAGSVSGDLWQGWGAGPMLGAVGVEYRDRRARQPHEQDAAAGASRRHVADVRQRLRRRDEGHRGILRDRTAAARRQARCGFLELNTAVRRTHYDNTETRYSNGAVNGQHDVDSWKVSTTYDPVDWVRIRASRSQDIRAAGFRELYYQQSIQSGAPNGRVINPYTRTANDEAFVLLTGSPDLLPEIAHTNTFGVVFSPQEWAKGLQFSVDYYRIKLKDGIQRGSSQLVVNNCATVTGPNPTPAMGVPVPAREVRRRTAPSSATTSRPCKAPYYNDAPYEADGVDFGGNYTFDIGRAIAR